MPLTSRPKHFKSLTQRFYEQWKARGPRLVNDDPRDELFQKSLGQLKLENDEEDKEELSCTAKPLHGISICTKEKWLSSRNPTSG